MKPLQLTRGCVLMETSREHWGIFVRYIGPSLDALLAAKCITPSMYRAFRKPCPGVPRRDADGDAIRQVRKGKRIDVSLYIRRSEYKALRLAGVRETLAPKPATKGLPAPVLLAAAAHGDIEGLRTKQRAVGRFQRLVEYATCENLIMPNWPALVRTRFDLQAS
jgi:hypothetical protein